jgi:hypothetical protein
MTARREGAKAQGKAAKNKYKEYFASLRQKLITSP